MCKVTCLENKCPALQICKVVAFSSLYKLRHKFFPPALLAGKMYVGCGSLFL